MIASSKAKTPTIRTLPIAPPITRKRVVATVLAKALSPNIALSSGLPQKSNCYRAARPSGIKIPAETTTSSKARNTRASNPGIHVRGPPQRRGEREILFRGRRSMFRFHFFDVAAHQGEKGDDLSAYESQSTVLESLPFHGRCYLGRNLC